MHLNSFTLRFDVAAESEVARLVDRIEIARQQYYNNRERTERNLLGIVGIAAEECNE